jgi:hypothetical protein
MCLITIAWKRKPTETEIEKAEKDKPDGIGIAFRKKGEIQIIKGLNLKEAKEAIEKAPLPMVIHYRWASVGGKGKELCHPFPITPQVPLTLVTKAPAVLFHNGHWVDWQTPLRNLAIARNEEIPDGKWSDSRAAAWIAARLGKTILHTISGKFCYFDNKECLMYGDGWCTVEEGKENVMYHSNRTWEYKAVTQYPTSWGEGEQNWNKATKWHKTEHPSEKRIHERPDSEWFGVES